MVYPDSVAAETVDRLNQVLMALPPNGIAYSVEQAALPTPLAHVDTPYALLIPPKELNGLNVANTAVSLHDGVDSMLRHAYPPHWRNLIGDISPELFQGFNEYYDDHIDELPMLSWSRVPVTFDRVAMQRGGRLSERASRKGVSLLMGYVSGPDTFPADGVYRAEPTTLDDIYAAKTSAINRVLGNKLRPRLSPQQRQEKVRLALSTSLGRQLFHQALGQRLVSHFLDSLEMAY